MARNGSLILIKMNFWSKASLKPARIKILLKCRRVHFSVALTKIDNGKN